MRQRDGVGTVCQRGQALPTVDVTAAEGKGRLCARLVERLRREEQLQLAAAAAAARRAR